MALNSKSIIHEDNAKKAKLNRRSSSVARGEDKGAARHRHRPHAEPGPDRLGHHGGGRRHRRRRARHGSLGKVLLGKRLNGMIGLL